MKSMNNQKMLDITKSQIVRGDSMKLIDRIPDGSITLVMSSPPYNIDKPYERGMFKSFDDYKSWMEILIEKIDKKVAENGSVCWQVGNHVEQGSVIPLDYVFFPIFDKLGYKLKNRIIWKFNFGLHATKRFSGRYETILWFTKSDKYKFNLDPVRVPQLYPGKRHSAKKGNRAGRPSGNPLGKNPSDIWEFDPKDAFFGESVWDIPNVKASHPEKTTHPCQFPNELAERCVLAMTDEGDLVFDPFSGTGATVIAAEGRDRVGLGIELDELYAKESNTRLAQLREGSLKLRHSGKAPRKPSSSEKVASIPSEWLEQTS